MIGHLSHPGLVLSSQSLCLLMLNSRRERLTSSSNCGLPHSFLTVTLHQSSITEISISRLTQLNLGISSGKVHASGMMVPSPTRFTLQSGRLQGMMFGIRTLVKSSRISWPVQTLKVTLITQCIRSSMVNNGSIAT